MKARINSKAESMAKARYAELKGILEGRRREILSEVQEKMRDVRAEGARAMPTTCPRRPS